MFLLMTVITIISSLLHRVNSSEPDPFGSSDASLTTKIASTTVISTEQGKKMKSVTQPFPSELSDEIQKAMNEDPKLFIETTEDNNKLGENLLEDTELQSLCAKFAPMVQKYCIPGNTTARFVPRCQEYFKDCSPYIAATDPLYSIANLFSTGVGINFGSLEVNGIPYYPINDEGSIGIGSFGRIPFGSWGGGYTNNFGIRDFWTQFGEYGGNWYEGKYGARTGFAVPIAHKLGIEGSSGVGVSVPVKRGEFGKPVGIDVGGGIGPYYQQNNHLGIDWLNGGVQQTFGVGVPIAGLGFNTGWNIGFPSLSSMANLVKKKQ